MQKSPRTALNLPEQNIEKLATLFPSCITESYDAEGNLKKVVNFKSLKTLLGEALLPEDAEESYEFTWVGKKKSILEAVRPIEKTLRPCKEESLNWDSTENLYIEGDNLEVLKLLQESYLNKVKMIYIDPPYNTGNDFIYQDDFKMSAEDYATESGAVDEEGNRLFKNTGSNGRFHSDWCSMIYSRLMLARNLLTEDGVIFISIDENEMMNLRKIADEVFGESNFISMIKIMSNPRGRQSDKHFATSGEFVLVYSKDEGVVLIHGDTPSEEQVATYTKKDEIGRFRDIGLRKRGSDSRREDSPTLFSRFFIILKQKIYL